jgi:hypothetical protein
VRLAGIAPDSSGGRPCGFYPSSGIVNVGFGVLWFGQRVVTAFVRV